MAADTIQIKFKTDSRAKDAPSLSINITLDELISTTKEREAKKLENLFEPSKKLNPDQSIEFMAFGIKLENNKKWGSYKKDVLDLLKTTDSSIIVYLRTNVKVNQPKKLAVKSSDTPKKETNQDRHDITSELDRLLDPTGKTEEEIAEIERLKRNLAAREGNPIVPQYNFFILGIAPEPPKRRVLAVDLLAPPESINFEELNTSKSDGQPLQSSNVNSFHSNPHQHRSIEAKPLPLEDEECDAILKNSTESTREDEECDDIQKNTTKSTREDERRNSCSIM